MNNYSKILWTLVIGLIIIKLAGVLFFIQEIKSYEDYKIAENIVLGNGYSEYKHLGPSALKAPLYPLFLSVFIYLFDDPKKIIVIFQLVLFTIISIPFYNSLKRISGKNAAFIISLIYLLYPSFLIYPFKIESTSITIPLLIIQFYYLIKHIKENKCICYFSIISALMFLHQPLSIIFTLFYLIYLKNWNSFARVIIAIVILSSPWLIRNYKSFDKIIPTKSPFWMNVYVGMDPEVQKVDYDLIKPEEKKKLDSLRMAINDVDLEEEYKKLVKPIILNNHQVYLKIIINNVRQFWFIPNKYLDEFNYQFIIGRVIPSLILNILTVYCLILLFNQNKKIFYLILFFYLLYTFPYAITHASNIRFKLDIEWTQIALLITIFKRKNNEV